MSTPLEQYGYVLLNTIEVPLFGTLSLLYKRNSEELWLQRSDGSLKLLAPSGAPSGSAFYYLPAAPSSANAGDRWVNTITGYEYTFIDDGVSTQWVQFR